MWGPTAAQPLAVTCAGHKGPQAFLALDGVVWELGILLNIYQYLKIGRLCLQSLYPVSGLPRVVPEEL